jgi:hypothetical protein
MFLNGTDICPTVQYTIQLTWVKHDVYPPSDCHEGTANFAALTTGFRYDPSHPNKVNDKEGLPCQPVIRGVTSSGPHNLTHDGSIAPQLFKDRALQEVVYGAVLR